MFIFALALIPVIALLLFIYFKDKTEKEPMGLLIGLFFAGMGTSITAMILELIGEAVFNLIFSGVPVLNAFLLAMLVVAPAEEMGKYTVLRLITWKNRNFDYSFDAIVYAVFTSLGFACIENVMYVFMNGWGTAIMRMFTAVPGHACFAVFMGFFYSKAKYASITGNKSDYSKYNALSMIFPIVVHGLYDAVIFAGTAMDNSLLTGVSFLFWIIFVVAMFVISFVMVHTSSKKDFCIVFLPGGMQTLYMPVTAGQWVCGCGTTNFHNFCSTCGKQRPMEAAWFCPNCGTASVFNFCGRCGTPKPLQAQMVAPMVGQPMMQPEASVQPLQPAQPGVQPMYQQPATPATPVQPVTSAQPAPQAYTQQTQYAQPAYQQPATPVAPVQPVTPAQPAPQAYTQQAQYAQPAYQQPVAPATPVQPVTTAQPAPQTFPQQAQYAQPAYQQPAAPAAPVQPVTTAQPAPQAYTQQAQYAQPAYQQPVQSIQMPEAVQTPPPITLQSVSDQTSASNTDNIT